MDLTILSYAVWAIFWYNYSSFSQQNDTIKVNTEMLKLEKESVSLFFLALTSNYFDEPNQL